MKIISLSFLLFFTIFSQKEISIPLFEHSTSFSFFPNQKNGYFYEHNPAFLSKSDSQFFLSHQSWIKDIQFFSVGINHTIDNFSVAFSSKYQTVENIEERVSASSEPLSVYQAQTQNYKLSVAYSYNNFAFGIGLNYLFTKFHHDMISGTLYDFGIKTKLWNFNFFSSLEGIGNLSYNKIPYNINEIIRLGVSKNIQNFDLGYELKNLDEKRYSTFFVNYNFEKMYLIGEFSPNSETKWGIGTGIEVFSINLSYQYQTHKHLSHFQTIEISLKL
jgi:hypothetical protein